MALVGEEALKQIWNLVKEKINEEKHVYKWSLTDESCTISVFRQLNICIIRIIAVNELVNFKCNLQEGFYPEEVINNENGVSIAKNGEVTVNVSSNKTISLIYDTSNLLPDEKYKV